MSRWQSLKQFLTLSPDLPVATRATAPDAVRSVQLVEWGGSRVADWSAISRDENLRTAWGRCATAYACITLLADAVAESPLRVYQTVDGELEERPDHRARTLLANPNPAMSEAEFMVLLVMTQGLFGYAAVEKVRSGGGIPVELWLLRPDWLTREIRSDGSRVWVYRRPTYDPRPIADEDLIIVPYRHDPSQIAWGVSPLQIVAREVGIDVAMTELLKIYIDNGGVPPWVVELDSDAYLDQGEADAFREKWRQTYGGGRAYSNIGIMNPGMHLKKAGDSIGEMAWPDLRGMTEAKIAQAFRVPLDLVQARETLNSGSLTTTEMDGAMAYLQNHGAQPLRTRIDGAFSRALLPDFTGGDGRFSLEFDTSGIMALQENQDALHTRVRADWNDGLISMNEARTLLGLPDLGGNGEVYKQTFTTMLVSASELVSAPDPQPGPARSAIRESSPKALPTTTRTERVYRDLKALSPAEMEVRANTLATARRERDRLAEIGARALRKFFKAQGQRIVDRIPTIQVVDKGTRAIITSKAEGIDWDAEARRLWDEVMAKFYDRVGATAFGHVASTVGVEIAWDLANPNIGRIIDELGRRIVGISEQTRQDVIRVVTDGQNDGLNLQQIADNLTGMFEETYKGRALTISRTETQVSYNRASQLGYQESGVVSTVEMVDNPDHPDDYGASDGLTCADRDGMIVPVGDMDRHIEAEHPNGSLAFIPILDKPIGEV